MIRTRPDAINKGGNQIHSTLNRVVVSGTGSFLPNEPVASNQIDDLLGRLDDAPQAIRTFVQKIGSRMSRITGIERRHFAIDPRTGEITHDVAGLAEHAARQAILNAGKSPEDIELLLLSCPSYDRSTPPTTTILQERLGIPKCAEMEIHSNCSGVGKIVQVAYDALRLGRYETALVVYPQLSSVYLRSQYLNQAALNHSQVTLRHILADGAGALLLEGRKTEDQRDVHHEILGTYVESIGPEREPGMIAGLGVADLLGPSSSLLTHYRNGTHHLDQDFVAVNRDAIPLLIEGGLRLLDSIDLQPGEIDHLILSIPSQQMHREGLKSMAAKFHLSPENMKFRAQNTGYCGGASLLLHFDEMVRAEEIKPGELVCLYSVESSKWMSGGFVVQW